ncbi:MAG: glycosyltransferase family 2 protein [Abditibacteriota bacterium]|nr:glycosyltransferase family 2 protein [Abditibacteriota bacterium]
MTSTSTPAISVILCVYNGEQYIGETLRSLARQTFGLPWELVVIDDCSTDGTPEILARWQEQLPCMRVFRNERNLRLQASLNRALEKAAGKYMVRIDADDVCRRDRLEKQYEYMESHPDIAVSSCRCMFLREGRRFAAVTGQEYSAGYTMARLLLTVPLFHPGVIARMDRVREHGYSVAHTCTEDLKLWTDIAAAGHKIAVQKDYLLLYRLHPGQITANTSDKQKEERRGIMKDFLARTLGYTETDSASYTDHLYFCSDFSDGSFLEEYKKLLRANRRSGFFDGLSLRRVLVEHLNELRRKREISSGLFCKGVLTLGIYAFVYETLFVRRCRREDAALIDAAHKLFEEE